ERVWRRRWRWRRPRSGPRRCFKVGPAELSRPQRGGLVMASMYDIMSGGAQAGGGGWGSLGQALGQAMSGGRGSSNVYDETMMRGHRTQKALIEAKRATQEYNALNELDLESVLPPHMAGAAPGMKQLILAGVNTNQF